MKSVLKKISIFTLITAFVLIATGVKGFAEDESKKSDGESTIEISIDSEEFSTIRESGKLPKEVLNYIDETRSKYPNAKVTITIPEKSLGAKGTTDYYTNYRTYGGHQLADHIVTVSNAHNMKNVKTGTTAGHFASNVLYYVGTTLISSVVPFYQYAVDASNYLLSLTSYTADPGDKVNAAPAYTTKCKFTFVKWNNAWSLGVQSFNATNTTTSWYIYLKAINRQATKTVTYNKNIKSSHYNSPDSAAVQYYQSGGLIDPKPKVTLGNASFYLY